MKSSFRKVATVVTRVALVVALAVGIALPVGYWFIAFNDFSNTLEFKAKVKANALVGLIATIPEQWMYAENRLQGLLAREPVPLETEAVEVFDDHGDLVTRAGDVPLPPVLRRSFSLYDGWRITGRVEVSDSLRGIVLATFLAGLVGLLLGCSVFVALRTLPLRALRRVTEDLFEQKQRAQITLASIGDAVITTDAGTRVEFLNPVAEQLSGWSLDEARNRPLSDVLHVVDATSGETVQTPLHEALSENRIVSFRRDIDLIRRDGTRIGIDDSGAPIHDETGRITGGVLIFRDVSVARDLTRLRSWEASHDPLTGLVNRREFTALVEDALNKAHGTGKQHVVCYLDLDRFKVVNDTCGHAAGDELLRDVARVLQSRIRESDTLARLGGDEFGLLLDGCSPEQAQRIANELLVAISDFRFTSHNKVFTIGVSVGLAGATGDGAGSAELLSMADTACYWAKEQGRNRVCVYRTGDSDMALRRREMGWITRINLALAENRFTLYHQSYLPLSAAAGPGKHIEVLLRMLDEDGSLIQPGSFLPAAERYNLMPVIDRWVVRTVFARYRELVAQWGGLPLTCAINLSGNSINAEGFSDFVRQLAAEHALPPRSICFEITETAAIKNLHRATEFIHDCKRLGILFALDDFGAGTSSFGYLKRLPVDYLKIDGGFVKNLERDPIDRAMTETINHIGQIMGIRTVAECAENAAIIRELGTIGVDYAQGFGVCLPTPLFSAPRAFAAPLREAAEAY